MVAQINVKFKLIMSKNTALFMYPFFSTKVHESGVGLVK